MKKLLLSFVGIGFVSISYAQPAAIKIDLKEAIRLAQSQSIDYQIAYNQYQSSLWAFRNFNGSLLPQLMLSGELPNYSRSISKVTLPTGEDIFVNQNQAYSTLYLSLQQQVGLTGGRISLGSNLQRIDVFGTNKGNSYNIVPVSLSYTQDNLGFNNLRWRKRIEPIRVRLANKQFTQTMEMLAAQTIGHYFQMLQVEEKFRLSLQNLNSNDSLYAIAQERIKIGAIDQGQLMQLRLNVLDAQTQYAQDSVDLALAKQQLSRYLGVQGQEISLETPDQIRFFDIPLSTALDHAKTNSKEILDFELRILEMEQSIAQVKSETGMRFSLRANVGMNNRAPEFGQLFNTMDQQQQVAISFVLPLVDWGQARTRRLELQANQTVMLNQIEMEKNQTEQTLALKISQWKMHEQRLEIVKESRELAASNYLLEIERYMRGTGTITELNAARNQRDSKASEYLNALKTYWDLYYEMRRLTLYDFERGAPLTSELVMQEF